MLKTFLLVILEIAIITGISVLGFGYLPEFGSVQKLGPLIKEARADTATTTATVRSTALDLTGAAESPVSTGTSPVNVGLDITFVGTGDDPNGDDYYLAICQEDSITTSSQAAPTCGGAGAWCISVTTTDESQATCSTTTQSGWSETEDWYAFACDYSTDPKCSTSSQGTGDSGSPFHVNHRPNFTDIVTGLTANPDGSITVTTTASDPDSGGSDTVDLYVCETASFSTSSGCGGDEFCNTTASSSNPSCTFNVDKTTAPGYEAGDVVNDGTYNYYAYIMDNHSFAANGGMQGSTKTYTVNNVAPVMGAVRFNSTGDITITADSSLLVHATTSITDANGCLSGAELSTASSTFYHDDATTSGCLANENYCYTSISASLGSCTTGTWGNVDATSTMYYNANPTDAGEWASTSGWTSDVWTALIIVTDDDGLTDSASSSQEVITTAGIDITEASITYGSLDPGDNTGSNNQTTTVETVGNSPIDAGVSAQTTLTSGPETISTSSQKYGTSSVAYASLSYNLSSTQATTVLESGITTDYTNPATDEVYWGLTIPAKTLDLNYTGVNLFTALERFPQPYVEDCACGGTGFETHTVGSDTYYVDCNGDKCWSTSTVSDGNWDDAASYCSGLDHAGFDDWTLPSCTSGTANSGCNLWALCDSDSCSGECWPDSEGSTGYYWSSTEYLSINVFIVTFSSCFVNIHSKSLSAYTRCVRVP